MLVLSSSPITGSHKACICLPWQCYNHLLMPTWSVQIEALILSANSNLTLAEIEDTFQFPLDGFQQQAVLRFLEGKSVLVCAPTGAGKTAIAEAAAVAVLARSVLLHIQVAYQVQHTPRTLVVLATLQEASPGQTQVLQA